MLIANGGGRRELPHSAVARVSMPSWLDHASLLQANEESGTRNQKHRRRRHPSMEGEAPAEPDYLRNLERSNSIPKLTSPTSWPRGFTTAATETRFSCMPSNAFSKLSETGMRKVVSLN